MGSHSASYHTLRRVLDIYKEAAMTIEESAVWDDRIKARGEHCDEPRRPHLSGKEDQHLQARKVGEFRNKKLSKVSSRVLGGAHPTK